MEARAALGSADPQSGPCCGATAGERYATASAGQGLAEGERSHPCRCGARAGRCRNGPLACHEGHDGPQLLCPPACRARVADEAFRGLRGGCVRVDREPAEDRWKFRVLGPT